MVDTERRENERHPVRLCVEYKRLNSFFSDYTKNISKGGTFIRTPKPLPIGTELVFELVIPRLETPLILRGKVVRLVFEEEATEQEPAGMGIHFVYAREEDRRQTEQVVEELIREELGDHISERLLKIKDPES